MQTEDDFSSQAVKDKQLAIFNNIYNNGPNRNPGMKPLVIEMLRSGSERDFKTLFFLNQILPNLSDFGHTELERNFHSLR